jgi:precorrin-2 dehydrogenase/sirohydrochlorin ferrochelatase
MYPILLDPAHVRAVVVGGGRGAVRRIAGLETAGISHIRVFAPEPDAEIAAKAGERLVARLPGAEDLGGANLVLVAGLEDGAAEAIATAARGAGIAVNVEDRPALCDFHLPATLRRGDLLLTASTGGRSPGLARAVRDHLDGVFGPQWAGRLDALAEARQGWRAAGADSPTVARRTQEWIDREGWLG